MGLVAILLLALGVARLTVGESVVDGTKDPVANADTGDDGGFFAGLAEQASKRAGGSDLLLRQIDLDLRNGLFVLRFTDDGATEEITVMAPSSEAPLGRWRVLRDRVIPARQWQVVRNEVSPLANRMPRPPLAPGSLSVSPEMAARLLQDRWPEAKVWNLTLAGTHDDLEWHVFGDLPEGVVRGTIPNATGVLQVVGPGRPAPRPASAPPPFSGR